MSRATVEISTGMRILTNRGVAIVVEIDRHGAHLRDSTGHTYFTAYTELDAREVSESGVQVLHSSLLPWFIKLPADVQASALFRQQCILEVRTGYREGVAELAQPGEPFWPFGETYGVSITKRYEHMSRLVSFERTVDRTIMQRVYDGEIQKPSISGRAMMTWDKNWMTLGLGGVVDGRSIRDKQGFDALDANFRRIAEEHFRQFDGRRSAISRNEIERRIRLQMKQEGLVIENLPERLMEEYLSHHWRAIGRTTKQQKSRSLRKVSGHESYPAQHSTQCCTDICRGDNLIWDPIQDRPVSVEIGSMMSTPSRVVTAMRLFPRSANGVDVGLLLYDSMRQQSMLVEQGPDGPTIDDWRWIGVPESLDFNGNPVRTGRRGAAKPDLAIWGEHQVPGVTPTSVRSDHGSIYVGKHFRSLLDQFGITLQLSRGKKPSDNPHIERLHETYQRFYQQSDAFKGRGIYERGSWVGVVADEPMCTAEKYLTDMQRFLTLDYSRQPHDGLHLPGEPGRRVTPLEYWDALFAITGRITIPVHPDLIYQFLPIIWLAPGHAGVEFKNLTYDDEVLEDFRDVRKGTFREQDSAIPFHHDPRDMTRIWFRHPDTDRIHEIGWRGRHLIDAPLVDVLVDRVNERIQERGGNRALKKRTIMLQIIDEIGDLTTPKGKDESRAQLSAAYIRWGQAQRDHDEVAEAHRAVELAQQGNVVRLPTAVRANNSAETAVSEPAQETDEEPWPDYREMV
ncbi:integrase-like protein [Knoellia remsis]|uniref:Integrase-like protein n=1 Tax=Knoellia remsis TaxID=407159 RepID=A0A2T0U3M0_9MICO|nr:integrase-like protein [Knoellia remsis]